MNRAFQPTPWQTAIRRRTFLRGSAYGLGGIALAGLLDPSLFSATAREADTRKPADHWRGVINPPHLPIKARRVIHLCMAGGPSQFESLDYKPMLKQLHGKPFPESFTRGQQLAQLQNMVLKARGPSCEFHRHGQSGQEISDLFPHIARIADRICIVRSMTTEQINHDPAHAFMNTGSIIKGRPSMGSWLLYGLGAETDDLPGFVVFTSAGATGQQPVSARQWSAGYLPSKFQGIQFQSRGDAVHYINNPPGIGADTQRMSIEEINRLNGMLAEDRLDPEIQTQDRPVRAGVPDAVVGARADRFRQRAEEHPGHVRHQDTRRRQLRLELPDGPAIGRARGPDDPALPPGLGPPRRHRARHAHRRARGRPGLRRPGPRPRPARDARGHAGPLGRRVRPHPDGPGNAAATITSWASRSGWPAAASRAASPMAPPTSLATRPLKTSCTCATCTPPSCTSAASITHGLFINIKGLM